MGIDLTDADGGILAAKGFSAGGVFSGIKKSGLDNKDLGMLVSDEPCEVAGVFSQNRVLSPSTALSRKRVRGGNQVRGVVVNSGCANCCVGEQGFTDAEEMTSLAESHINAHKGAMLVASTGVIGVELPMALVRNSLPDLRLSRDGGEDFARSILTTDSFTKQTAFKLGTEPVITIGGVAKGSGMIHPDMATMLAFLTTDALVESAFLQKVLSDAVQVTFNQIDIDGDQSTNDMVLLMANGASGAPRISGKRAVSEQFAEAVRIVCERLAKDIARDGEGARCLIEMVVSGAETDEDARAAARSVVSSTLVKTAIYGNDPNWGRIMMALGKSGAHIRESAIDIFINGINIVTEGKAISFNIQSVVQSLASEEVRIEANLNIGEGRGIAWGCDLTEEYVVFNSAYTT